MDSFERLTSRVKTVRRKWRTQMLVRGGSLFLACAIAFLVLGVWGADLFGFKPAAEWTMRILAGAAVVIVAVRFLLLPMRRRISDVQIAQFIEERYPQLEDRLITAIEFGHSRGTSPGMLDLLIRDALEKSSRLDFSVFLRRRRLLSYAALGVGALLALMTLLWWGPSFFPYGFGRLYIPWNAAALDAPVMIEVVPGNAELAKGTDQQIKAHLVGFDSPDVRLSVQPVTATAWSSVAMEPESLGSGFRYLLVDLQGSMRYYVEAKGVRSQTYTLKVVDLPKVERIDLTYNFPAYTGMEPQAVENQGDISAIKGTRVDLKIHLNRPARAARLFFDNQSALELSPAGSQDFTGRLALERSGSYVVQVTDDERKQYAASSEYEIEAIEDLPPKVSISKPMRDLRATSVEEVFSEIKADDDIGVAGVELRYSVNGAPEKSVTLYQGKPAQSNVTAAHTFFLEEFGLQPGDVITYYGKATDNNSVTGPSTSSSDIYFIHIRPFEQKYTQSQQGGGSGGGGGEGAEENLSKQQKEIISATFKLIRDKDRMDRKEYSDGLKSLALVQSRLQGQAQGLVDRLRRRGAVEVGVEFSKLAEYLKAATVEMGKAAADLGAEKPSDALPSEQKALQQLMRAESLFREIQISFGARGAGGGQSANAEDLADLFELELNKLKNQYETIQRGEQEARDQKLDEALQRLKELAQRQQQLNERNRLMAQRGGSASASSGGGQQGQQQLMDEAEKLQRQLQRLSRERSSQELNRVSSQLQQAIQEMKKSLDRSRAGAGQEAAAQGIRALQQLEEARRALARGQDAGLSQGVEQALEESRSLVEEQRRIQEGMDRLARDRQQSATADFQGRRQNLTMRKGLLADRLKTLGNKIDDLSRQARKTQRETSSKLSEAAGTIRDKRLPERILSGNQLVESGYYDLVKPREDYVRAGLEDLSKQLESAKNSIGQTREGKVEDALGKARQLAEGLEAMQQRVRNAQRGQQQQPGTRAQAQRSQSGEQGEAEPQGPPGQQGPQGQQGSQRGGGQPSAAQGQNQPNQSGGSPGRDARGLTADAYGPPIGIGDYAEGTRQLRREFQERLMDAQELRRMMDRNSTQMPNLERVLDILRNMESARDYNDPAEVARLRAAIDAMRQIELDLSRELARLTQKERYFSAEDSEAPSRYKRLVEEYYKALAKGKP